MNKQHVTRNELHTKVLEIGSFAAPDAIDRPNEEVTRLEAAMMLSNMLPAMNSGIAGALKAPFPDITTLTAEQQAAVAHMYHLGLMVGNVAGNFEPHLKLRQDEAVQILHLTQQRLQARKRSVPFEVIHNAEDLPQQVANSAAGAMIDPGFQVVHSEAATYVIVSGGERPTGGYSIEPTSVVQANGQIEIQVELIRPDPEMMHLQAFTYPQLILRLPKLDQPIVLLNLSDLTV
ncbi:hypothetical protein CIG75_16425 [Tumebacillus algifaecis]|uniref:Uncharacterized protein n=1 Tax=Tumebacillus algifaecis TaxID=1214604 RepID=A0A223D470_9BACL|nr:protease complex subunit PrcB family protein [Tumebacillus algifaecis]ASS76382.1 hypothetical protein CIG75_16425 [Tumebacillus algifaecis]